MTRTEAPTSRTLRLDRRGGVMTTTTTTTHTTSVEWKGGRYPYQPTCSCGWTDWGYVAEHAAQILCDAHEEGKA